MEGVGKPEISISEEETKKIEKIVGEEFLIQSTSVNYDEIGIYFELEGDVEKKFNNTLSRLKKIGFILFLDKEEEIGKITVKRYREPTVKTSKKHLILFIATIITTLIAGALMFGVDVFNNPLGILRGWPFSLSIMLILGTHELGHYIISKRRGVAATLPYFIPVPPPFILGTLGAVIQTKSPIPSRKSLLDIGAAGPLLGIIFAIPVTLIGLYLSPITVPTDGGLIELGRPLIYQALTYLIPVNEGGLHPVAFAGWVGFFVTFLNLLPVGQLDGGHVSRALFGEKHQYISSGVPIILLALGFYLTSFTDSGGGEIWIFWGFITLFFHSAGHPPPLNNVTKPDMRRKLLGLLVYIIFIACFTPVPFRITGV